MHGLEYGYLDDYNIVTCALNFVKMISLPIGHV